jgi:hypothetical protein
MHQSKKGKNWYFGMKAHIGVDTKSGLTHHASYHVGQRVGRDAGAQAARKRTCQDGTSLPHVEEPVPPSKTRHRGLAKNTAQLFVLFGASRIWSWPTEPLGARTPELRLERGKARSYPQKVVCSRERHRKFTHVVGVKPQRSWSTLRLCRKADLFSASLRGLRKSRLSVECRAPDLSFGLESDVEPTISRPKYASLSPGLYVISSKPYYSFLSI